MPKIRFGRKARVYVSATSFASGDLTVVRRTKDVEMPDEAEDMKATARDLDYAVHGQGGKDLSLTFKKIIESDDTGADVVLLQTAYDEGTELFVVVCRADKTLASGQGRKFKATVLKWPNSYPESGSAEYDVMLAPSDPDNLPTRITTPVA